MKYRQGFVSNSSSSSFIVGVGKIKNLNDFKNWAKDKGVDICTEGHGDVQVKTTADILTSESWIYEVDGNKLSVEEPVNYGGKITGEFDPAGDDRYCIVYIGNNEGDDSFWNGDDYDYYIDKSYFWNPQYDILEMLQEGKLLEGSAYSFGAGRNG